MYNLLYNKCSKKVVNVDLEGFYVHYEESRANNANLLLMQLRQLRDVIKIYTSGDLKSNNVKKVLAVINHANSAESYDTKLYAPGYHSVKLGSFYLRGRRECNEILAKISDAGIDFKDKVVLDIGCGTGGMLHALTGLISIGVGIDHDSRLVNAANLIKQVNRTPDIAFYGLDYRMGDLSLIPGFVLSDSIDICLVLSLYNRARNWDKVIEYTAEISNVLVCECSGAPVWQDVQVNVLNKAYRNVQLISDLSDDEIRPVYRKLYLCSN